MVILIITFGIVWTFKRDRVVGKEGVTQTGETALLEPAPKTPRPGLGKIPPTFFEGQRAEEFPFNLKTFDDWQQFTEADLIKYRASLISRVGRWEASEIAAFFHEADPGFSERAAQQEFRSSVLGAWCAKDAEGCLASMEKTLKGDDAFAAKQAALGSWARDDWMTALRFLHRYGDEAIENRLGGDSTRYIAMLVRNVRQDNGIEEARELVNSLHSERNKVVALEELN